MKRVSIVICIGGDWRGCYGSWKGAVKWSPWCEVGGARVGELWLEIGEGG